MPSQYEFDSDMQQTLMQPMTEAIKNTTSFYCGKVPHIFTTQLQLHADEQAVSQLQPEVKMNQATRETSGEQVADSEVVGKIPDEL